MSKQQVSDKGDLTAFTQRVVDVFAEEFGGEPAVAIAFTLPEDYAKVHWVTNVRRGDALILFEETALTMRAQVG